MECQVKARKVTMKGPRGVLRRAFRHMAVDIHKTKKDEIIVEKWFGISRELAAVRTVCSHIENMIKGVTKVSKISRNMIKEIVQVRNILIGI